MRRNLLFIIVPLTFLSCNIGNTPKKVLEKNFIIETYTLKFEPSFHDNLNLDFKVFFKDSIKLTISQDAKKIRLFDTIVNWKQKGYAYESFGESSKAISLVKPNFTIDFILSKEECAIYLKNLEILKSQIIEPDKNELISEDGLFIIFTYEKKGIKKVMTFQFPNESDKANEALTRIIKSIGQNPCGIIEKTSDDVFQYMEHLSFKLVSKNPLYVKIFDTPCCPCQPEIEKFVMSLPTSDEIFLDIRNYSIYGNQKVDLTCIREGFRKKFKHLRWIMNSDDEERFHGLLSADY
jgi:hypothetical protein